MVCRTDGPSPGRLRPVDNPGVDEQAVSGLQLVLLGAGGKDGVPLHHEEHLELVVPMGRDGLDMKVIAVAAKREVHRSVLGMGFQAFALYVQDARGERAHGGSSLSTPEDGGARRFWPYFRPIPSFDDYSHYSCG